MPVMNKLDSYSSSSRPLGGKKKAADHYLKNKKESAKSDDRFAGDFMQMSGNQDT